MTLYVVRILHVRTSVLTPLVQCVRRAAYIALGQSKEAAAAHIEATPEVYGVVMGDVARVCQVVTNLTSNACKFTPQGGTISISTRLLVSFTDLDEVLPPPDEDTGHVLSSHHLTRHDADLKDEKPKPFIVVRIEVEDTGPGIDSADIRKLFSELFLRIGMYVH